MDGSYFNTRGTVTHNIGELSVRKQWVAETTGQYSLNVESYCKPIVGLSTSERLSKESYRFS